MSNDTDRMSPVSQYSTSPISPVSSRTQLTDKELILRFKLIDAQRQRGKVTQSRYEAKRRDLLNLCSNEEFLTLVHQHDTSLGQGRIDQAGYDKRLRFLFDRLGDPATLAEADKQHEAELRAEESLDKSSRRIYDTPRLPKVNTKAASPEQRSPEEEKFFASDAEQGWAFDNAPSLRSASVERERRAPPPKDALYGSASGYDASVDPFEGDGWRVNIASIEPRGDVERPVRAAINR